MKNISRPNCISAFGQSISEGWRESEGFYKALATSMGAVAAFWAVGIYLMETHEAEQKRRLVAYLAEECPKPGLKPPRLAHVCQVLAPRH